MTECQNYCCHRKTDTSTVISVTKLNRKYETEEPWETRVTGRLQRELGFGCSHMRIGLVKWIYFIHYNDTVPKDRTIDWVECHFPTRKDRECGSTERVLQCSAMSQIGYSVNIVSAKSRTDSILTHTPLASNGLCQRAASMQCLSNQFPLFLHKHLASFLQIGTIIDLYQSLGIWSVVLTDPRSFLN